MQTDVQADERQPIRRTLRRNAIKLKIISCNVMSHELRYCAALSPNRIDIQFLHEGLHEFPSRLNATVMDALKAVEASSCDYILLNYGLCGNGTLNISHDSLPIVIHNVQDCIPLILGDEERHRAYVEQWPGTFWFSVGWIEGFPLPGSPDYNDRYKEFYGRTINEKQRDTLERILMENYTHLTYIGWDELGEAVNGPGREYTMACVNSLNERLEMGLECDQVSGNPARLQRFTDGDWNMEEFLIIQPGKRLQIDMADCRLCAQ
jgi:hypothetical protein